MGSPATPAVNSQIFDRKEILARIAWDVQSPERPSRAVIGAHKVGKSFLLRHFYDNRGLLLRPPNKYFFCFMTKQLLAHSLGPAQFSNEAVYTFLWREVRRQLDAWVTLQAAREQFTLNELENAKRFVQKHTDMLTALDEQAVFILDPIKRAEIKQNTAVVRSAREQYLAQEEQFEIELEQLRLARNLLSDLKPFDQQLLSRSQAASFGKRLNLLGIVIVLVVDDFQDFVADLAFDKELFSYLRASMSARDMVVVVSLPMHPMDAARRADLSPKEQEHWANLQNTFFPLPIGPFHADQAGEFLEWLANQEGKVIDKAEIRYLCELGGGSTHFLRLANDLYHLQTPPMPREEFERLVYDNFRSSFQELWQRCNDREKVILRQVVTEPQLVDSNSFIVTKLEKSGFLVREDTSYRPFSPLFAQFVRDQ